ncbi:MAG: DNA polymerase IV [Chlamydiota bacterium]
MSGVIIHIDMDAFYASVEQRENKAYDSKPVVVGGDPNSRGVVAACSYEARKFGVHSAMPSYKAYKLCPDAIFVKLRMNLYKQVSEQIRAIFYEYTDIVEPLALDEAFLDVTDNKLGISSATEIAIEIRKRIKEVTSLTASAGVSYNKFLAKISSDYNKPDGITVIPPHKAEDFISLLPIGKFFGIGKVTEAKMKSMGIIKGADLQKISLEKLVALFGKAGGYYYSIARGIDHREVVPDRIRKSIGAEITFDKDIDDHNSIIESARGQVSRVVAGLNRENARAKTISIKVKYNDFSIVTRTMTLHYYINNMTAIYQVVEKLLDKVDFDKKMIRLIGVSASSLKRFDGQQGRQLSFFDLDSSLTIFNP